MLTHWGQLTHICVRKLTIIGTDNGLSPGRRQAIIWNNAAILLIGTLSNTLQWNRCRYLYIFIQENTFEIFVWKMAAILSRPQCVNVWSHVRSPDTIIVEHTSWCLSFGHHIQWFNFNLKQIYCPTKYRIQHHVCDYMTQTTTGKISMNMHTYTYVYKVTYMLNFCPTLNQMLGDIHLRPLENENGNVLDQFHWSLVQCVTRNGCHSKWSTQTDKTT